MLCTQTVRTLHKKVLFCSLALLCAHAQAESAATILAKAQVKGGIIVCIGADDPELLVGLAPDSRYLVHCIDTDLGKIEKARNYVKSKGRYGQISVDQFDGKTLPYTDNLINLVVVLSGNISKTEIGRVLCPLGTVYKNGQITTKSWPDDIKEWTHWLQGPHGNAVGGSRLTEPPRHLQWIQPPLHMRHHNMIPALSALVSAQGRIFYIMDEGVRGTEGPDQWKLIARDAFNGTLLWKIPIKEWGWKLWSDTNESGNARYKNPDQVTRRLGAVGDKVFVTLGVYGPVQMLDAATGKVLQTYKGTEKTSEVMYQDNRLFLAVNKTLDNPKVEPDVSILAVDVQTGERLWEHAGYKGIRAKLDRAKPYVDTCLTCGDGQVFLVNQTHIIGIDGGSGKEKWKVERPQADEKSVTVNDIWKDYYIPNLPTLVYHDKRLFYSQILHEKKNLTSKKSKTAVLEAVDTRTGQKIWSYDCTTFNHLTPPDIFVIRGLVWTLKRMGEGDPGIYVGLDPKTAEEKQSIDVTQALVQGAHHNCYRNKATERFIIIGKSMSNSIDLKTGTTTQHNWIKGACRIGVMPANGMLYFPTHFCKCFLTSKLSGFFALAPLPAKKYAPSTAESLKKGPAYGAVHLLPETKDTGSWPAFRHDNLRSNCSDAAMPATVSRKWSAKIGGALSQPIVVGQRVFVAAVDQHELLCLDRKSGETLWRYVAGGRIDSPPSWYRGLLVFGSRDGHITCLKAETGKLVWRFRAAPADLRMSAFAQLESAWPAFGSQIVQDGKVYCCAGRSMNLSSGVYMYALDVKTGAVLVAKNIAADLTTMGELKNSVLTDILVGDDKRLHMRGLPLNTQTFQTDGRHNWGSKKKTFPPPVPYIEAYCGFLDSSWYNDSYLTYGGRSNVGHLLALDKVQHTLYGLRGYKKYGVSSNMQDVKKVGADGYLIFSRPEKTSNRKKTKGKKGNKSNRGLHDGAGDVWSRSVRFRGLAMVVGKDTLYLVGVPDKYGSDDDPWKYLEGRGGGVLAAFSKDTGEQLFDLNLESAPVFDGMAAAYGELFISCNDGTIQCYGK